MEQSSVSQMAHCLDKMSEHQMGQQSASYLENSLVIVTDESCVEKKDDQMGKTRVKQMDSSWGEKMVINLAFLMEHPTGQP